MILIADIGVIAIKAGQFILSFSILIVLHEFGHYITAKWFGCRVEKFYLFFNPWFSLFKKKVGETEYGVGWVPLGGYVKISGMIDESMDKEAMKKPPEPYEFRSKPAWQRLIIMLGGVIVNVILAIIIFIFITWKWGEEFIPIANLKYGVYADSLGRKIGLQDGDRIIAVDGKKIDRVGTTGAEIIMNEAKSVTVDRNGQNIELKLYEGFIRQLNKNRLKGFSYVRVPMIVDTITPDARFRGRMPMKGDRVIAYRGRHVLYDWDVYKDTTKYKHKYVPITYIRNEKDTINVLVYYNKKGSTNIGFKPADEMLGTEHISYSFLESIPAGWNRCWETLFKYARNLKQLFTSKEIKFQDSLGSFLSIGDAYSSVWNWQSFWTLTAVFSIILAFMNVLPIPALDGGHALFTLYEMITGHKPSDKFMEYAQMVGMILLFGLMAYAMGLDIFRIFK